MNKKNKRNNIKLGYQEVEIHNQNKIEFQIII